jgi:hypothetical protein
VTKRQVQRAVERYVAARFPDLQPLGDLLVARNGPLLRGFLFDRSQLDKFGFRLHAFVKVLSVPQDYIDLGLSRELGDFSAQDGGEEATFLAAAQQAEAQGRPYLAMVSDCEALAANMEPAMKPWATSDCHVNEARAHCLIWLGRDREARRELEKAARDVDPPERDWERRLLERVRLVEEKLDTSHQAALTLLTEWADQTTRALGLEELREGRAD